MFKELFNRLPRELNELDIPSAADRELWERLPDKTRGALTERGESRLGFVWPSITAADYMDFSRTGNRTRFEGRYFERRRALYDLVLAECTEYKGRFIDDIINGVWCVCEESGWQLPPHNNYVRDTQPQPLPDTAHPVPELFACETGASLAVLRRLLGSALDAASPLVCERILHEINARLITPYLTGHFWWMGNGDERMCNWTSWCTQNMLLAAFSTDQPQDVKHKAACQACESLDCFIKDYGEDGCCEEGALYYRHAGLTLWGALELLNSASNGLFSPLFGTRKIKNMAAYIKNVHIGGEWYLNYGDCGPKPGACGAREYYFGRRTGDAELMQLAATDIFRRNELPDSTNLAYRLLDIFFDQTETICAPEAAVRPDIYYPSTGLWTARDEEWRVSVRAGRNCLSHGHNDAGSVIVFRVEKPVLIDIGVESYTAKTFSAQRGELWTIRSDWHNLPTIGGNVQKTGSEYGASDVKVTQNGETSAISMQLAGAYSDEPDFSYQRAIVLEKNKRLVITDEYDGKEKAVLSLLFCDRPAAENGKLTLSGGVTLRLSGGGKPNIEEVQITDARLRQGWPALLYRVLIEVKGLLTIAFESETEEK